MRSFARIICITVAMVMLLPLTASGQNISDVYLVPITNLSTFQFGTPENISDYDGYDNQPMFTLDGNTVLYVSERGEPEDKQADIYTYDMFGGNVEQLTDTPDAAEFSPMPMLDDEHFSVVRMEGEPATLMLYQYDFNIDDLNPRVLLYQFETFNYYAWYSEEIVMASVDNLVRSILGDIDTNRSIDIIDNPGRCYRKVPNEEAMSFVSNADPNAPIIQKIDMSEVDIDTDTTNDEYDITDIIEMLPGTSDFEWTPNGILLAAQERKLYKFDPDADDEWQEVHEFTTLTEEKIITRLAIDPQGRNLAMVVRYGCMIDGEPYGEFIINPENECEFCYPEMSNTEWSTIDGLGCDDGLFCNGTDTCLDAECTQHTGDPCADDETCDEDNDECVSNDDDDDTSDDDDDTSDDDDDTSDDDDSSDDDDDTDTDGFDTDSESDSDTGDGGDDDDDDTTPDNQSDDKSGGSCQCSNPGNGDIDSLLLLIGLNAF